MIDLLPHLTKLFDKISESQLEAEVRNAIIKKDANGCSVLFLVVMPVLRYYVYESTSDDARDIIGFIGVD